MVRWTIPLDTTARASLRPDHLELGSLVTDPMHGDLLTFRDRFVAMKVAAQLGARAEQRTLEDATSATPQRA